MTKEQYNYTNSYDFVMELLVQEIDLEYDKVNEELKNVRYEENNN